MYTYNTHTHPTKPNHFILKILGSMGPPPWEDIAVPLAPDGGHYAIAYSTDPYIHIYIHIYMYISQLVHWRICHISLNLIWGCYS